MAGKLQRKKRFNKGKRSVFLAVIILGGLFIFSEELAAWLNVGIEDETFREQVFRSGEEMFGPNKPPSDEIIRGDTTLMELPRLSGGNNNYFVTHYAGGRVNYSLEYDILKRHARWVAFSFDNISAEDNVVRSNAWRWDPDIPAEYSTDNWFQKTGYSRGHLVASEDRTYTQQANEQTFYYSNISPQIQQHNGGVWMKLEQKIQAWGRSPDLRDVLYVVKGGTIRDDQIKSQRIRQHLVIPRYYWAALLLKKHDAYHSIAFLTEHRRYERGEGYLRDLALSVDQLEVFTGLDFFHRLPDDIEQEVEAEDPNSRLARTIWWN